MSSFWDKSTKKTTPSTSNFWNIQKTEAAPLSSTPIKSEPAQVSSTPIGPEPAPVKTFDVEKFKGQEINAYKPGQSTPYVEPKKGFWDKVLPKKTDLSSDEYQSGINVTVPFTGGRVIPLGVDRRVINNTSGDENLLSQGASLWASSLVGFSDFIPRALVTIKKELKSVGKTQEEKLSPVESYLMGGEENYKNVNKLIEEKLANGDGVASAYLGAVSEKSLDVLMGAAVAARAMTALNKILSRGDYVSQIEAWKTLGSPATQAQLDTNFRQLSSQVYPRTVGADDSAFKVISNAKKVIDTNGLPGVIGVARNNAAKYSELIGRETKLSDPLWRFDIKPKDIQPSNIGLTQLPGYRDIPGQSPAAGLSTKKVEPVGFQVKGLDLKNPIDTVQEIADIHLKEARNVLKDISPADLKDLGGQMAVVQRAKINLVDGLNKINDKVVAEAINAIPIDQNTTIDAFQGAVQGLINPKAVSKLPVFAGFKDLSTKILDKLVGRSTVSKEFISNLTNSGDLKQTERDIIRKALETEGNTVNVDEFADKVKAELLPLERSKLAGTAYENIAILPSEVRGDVADYGERIYSSPIKTNAGLKHFSGKIGDYLKSDKYFGHTRTEDMADKETRRIIEVQSDLFQKGNLELEKYNRDLDNIKIQISNVKSDLRTREKQLASGAGIDDTDNLKAYIKTLEDKRDKLQTLQDEKLAQLPKLEQYNDPTAHFRMVREEIKQAAQDGKTKLQFPTGETAMKVEGLGDRNIWFSRPTNQTRAQIDAYKLKPDNLRIGQDVYQNGLEGNQWIITDVLDSGKFRAAPKKALRMFFGPEASGMTYEQMALKISEKNSSLLETFDISGKVDTNNPIYRFYEKDLGRYLANNYGAKRVVDNLGISWYELPIKAEMGTKPVQAFKKGSILGDKSIDIEKAKEVVFKDIPKDQIRLIFTDELIEGKALGMYSPAVNPALKPIIRLFQEGGKVSVATTYHESAHYLFDNFVPEADLAAAREIAKQEIGPLAKAQYKLAKYPEDQIIDEYMADKYARYKMNEAGYTESKLNKFFRQLDAILKKIVDTIKKVKENISKFIKESGGAQKGAVKNPFERPMKQEVYNAFNEFSNIEKGAKILNPTGEVSSGLMLDSKIADIIGTKPQELYFTRLSLKHLAEKGQEGKRLLKAVPAILKNPEQIYKNRENGRFLISSSETNTKYGYLDTVVLELQKIGNDILVTVMPTRPSYFDDVKRFESLWRGAVSPSRIPSGGAGSPTISGRTATQKVQPTEIVSPPLEKVKSLSQIDKLIAEGKIRVVSRDRTDVYQYKKGDKWVNALNEDSAVKQVTSKPYESQKEIVNETRAIIESEDGKVIPQSLEAFNKLPPAEQATMFPDLPPDVKRAVLGEGPSFDNGPLQEFVDNVISGREKIGVSTIPTSFSEQKELLEGYDHFKFYPKKTSKYNESKFFTKNPNMDTLDQIFSKLKEKGADINEPNDLLDAIKKEVDRGEKANEIIKTNRAALRAGNALAKDVLSLEKMLVRGATKTEKILKEKAAEVVKQKEVQIQKEKVERVLAAHQKLRGLEKDISKGLSPAEDETLEARLMTEQEAFDLRKEEFASFDKIVVDTSRNVKEKIGALDYFRTPDRVLAKLGLSNLGKDIRTAYQNYLAELPQHLDLVTEWANRVSSKDGNVRIFRYLDGQRMPKIKRDDGTWAPLNITEQRVADEIKTYLEDWAYRLGLPEDEKISHYITHIFFNEEVPKEFDEDIAKIIKDKVPGSVFDPFLEKRLGRKGYIEDTWKSLDAYIKRAVRKANMDQVLEKFKDVAPTLEDSQLTYIKKYVDRVNLRPTDWDNLLDNTVKQLIGYKLGQRPTALITRKLRQAVYRGALGLNVGSAIKNLTQGVNTFAKLGTKYTTLGYIQLLTNTGASKELHDSGILAKNFIEDRAMSATKKGLQTADKVLFAMFDMAEYINRGAAYFAAKAKYMDLYSRKIEGGMIFKKGVDPKTLDEEAMKYATEFAQKLVRDTQFQFGSIDTPLALSSDIAKTLFQFGSYSIKQTEFITEMVKNKEWGGLVRYILASLGLVYVFGNTFNLKLSDFVPLNYFATLGEGKLGRSLALPTELVKAILNTPNEFGQPRSTKQKIDDVLNSGVSLVPGGVQGQKTYRGLKKYFTNDTPQTVGQFTKASLLGSSNIIDISKEEKKKIQPIFDEVQKLKAEGKEYQSIIDGLTDAEYDVYKKIKAADQAKKTIAGKEKMLPIYKSNQKLKEQGKTDEVTAIMEAMSEEDYKYYQAVKKDQEAKIKAQTGEQPSYDTNDVLEPKNVLGTIVTYAKAIGTDPVTAFNRIFTGQTIRYVANDAIVVERMSLVDSQKVKNDRGGNNPTMKLDHTIPLQLGGSNSEKNLQLVPTDVWSTYTPVENAIGKALRSNKINRAKAQELIQDFKSGKLSAENIYSELK